MKSPCALLLLTVIFLLNIYACKEKPEGLTVQLGELNFEPTGKAEAQPSFHKGLLLLHSFEYADAADAFREARTIDPDFVMAYWGEAMTCNHPLWQEQDLNKGNEILTALAPTAEERKARAKSELESDFIHGVNILYGPGDKSTRDSLYAGYMETLYQKYPGNDEVAAFYSLALNGWATTEKNKEVFERAADIANEVINRNPKHPGALHYLIHAYDDPDHATLALQTADEYAQVAPDAGHALHMPTHTYVALGLWDKVVSSNIESWQAEKTRKEKKQLDNNALGYHAYFWLQYGYLQLGQLETALAMIDTMKTYCDTLASPRARTHLIYMKAAYLAETGDYHHQVSSIEVDSKDLNIVTRAKDYYSKGMNAWQSKDKSALDKIIKQLADERVIEDLKSSGTGLRMCGNINFNMATNKDLQEAEVMELELRAMRAILDNDSRQVESYLKQAVALQDIAGYAYGPPSIVKPSYELYGEWLLERQRPKDALDQFERSLKVAPNKRLSVIGKGVSEKAIAL